MLGQFDIDHGQRDGDAAPGREHPVDVAVVGIVIIVDVAGKGHFLEEEMVEHAQLLDLRSVRGQALLELGGQRIERHLLFGEIHLGIEVLTQRQGGFEQGNRIVLAHQ